MLRVSWALVKMKVLAYEGRGAEQRVKARFIKTVVAVCLNRLRKKSGGESSLGMTMHRQS